MNHIDIETIVKKAVIEVASDPAKLETKNILAPKMIEDIAIIAGAVIEKVLKEYQSKQ